MLTKSDIKRLKAKAKKAKISFVTGWSNFSGSQRLPDALVFDIPNRLALQILIKKIYKLNKDRKPDTKITYHAAGGGKKKHVNTEYNHSFSFSPCATADVILRLTGDEFQQITVDAEKKQATAGAGLQIGYLDNVLYHQYGLSIPASSKFGDATNVGLGGVSGHGTGNQEDSFSGLIQAFTICRPDGEIVTLDADHEDFETIRTAHLGLFGIVLDQTIQCRRASKIYAKRDATYISDLIKQLKEGLVFNNRRVSILYTPTYHNDERNQTSSKNVLIIKADAVSRKIPDKNNCRVLNYLWQDLLIRVQEALKIPDILNKDPQLIPEIMRYVVSPVSIGSDNEAIGPWPDIMHDLPAYPRKIDDMDYLFQLSKDSHELIDAIEFVVATLDQFAKKGQYPVTYGAYIRVFAGTNGGLSTSQHDEDKLICAFDIVSNPETPGYVEFKHIMQDYFLKVCHAKPHWGKTVPLDVDYEEMYGDNFRRYKQALEKWHKQCGLELSMSPLITPFFSKILKLPLPIEEPLRLLTSNLAFFQPPPASPRTRQKCKAALKQITDQMVAQNPESAKLQQRIMKI